MVVGVDVVALSTIIRAKVRSITAVPDFLISALLFFNYLETRPQVAVCLVPVYFDTMSHRRVPLVVCLCRTLAQVEDGEVWREMVRDGVHPGGGESRPSLQPLSQRLSGLRPDLSKGSEDQGDMRDSTCDRPLIAVCDTKKPEKENEKKPEDEKSAVSGLTLDEPIGIPESPGDKNNSPTRGPPKTPKRIKGSSPQPSDVSLDTRCKTCSPCAVRFGQGARTSPEEETTVTSRRVREKSTLHVSWMEPL